MSGAVEYGRCDICGKEAPLARRYFHYGIPCECHSPNHFELVRHCKDCEPKEPGETTVKLRTDTLRVVIERDGNQAVGFPEDGQSLPARIKPLGDRVVVRMAKYEETTKSGLVIPDAAKEKPQEGTVVAVGPGRVDTTASVPLGVKVGDRVLFSKYGGTEIKLGGEDLLVLTEHDILGVIGTENEGA